MTDSMTDSMTGRMTADRNLPPPCAPAGGLPAAPEPRLPAPS